eukprot:CAMPEP_0206247006 /NCGR_PEP_ID=MMETSP0047_2-20121206/19575_1 /ASSEMBLY_ACC=CAM_ASM_000192 /TAXON_ID=195065 /ORGANISM="Chroomonas mesostigmatica_cf, Strain CCMP1168" /LENGTH=54 /DNA_ID=CAMNT_0053672493 /DNA_START=297 /DNA_END=461 /DNA_ORIENTATION=-
MEPSVLMMHVCASPAATAMGAVPACAAESASLRGSTSSLVDPCPSRPSIPQPHV